MMDECLRARLRLVPNFCVFCVVSEDHVRGSLPNGSGTVFNVIPGLQGMAFAGTYNSIWCQVHRSPLLLFTELRMGQVGRMAVRRDGDKMAVSSLEWIVVGAYFHYSFVEPPRLLHLRPSFPSKPFPSLLSSLNNSALLSLSSTQRWEGRLLGDFMVQVV